MAIPEPDNAPTRNGSGRIEAVLKGRPLSQAAADLARFARDEGPRGLTHRVLFELARALSNPEPTAVAPAPLVPGLRAETHTFHVARCDFYDPSSQVLEANRRVVDQFDMRARDVKTATWFVPWFNHVLFGGINTILRFISWMRVSRGVEPRIVVYDHPSLTDDMIRTPIAAAFPELRDIDIVLPPQGLAPFVDFDELPQTDIGVCTIWYSAFALLRFNQTRAKFYFVQDFEPAFYPAGTLWALAESTYRFGFAGLVNTPGLAQAYSSYGNPTCAFVPGVDPALQDTMTSVHDRKPVKVVIYGRPSTERNGFELLAAACEHLKRRYGDSISIFSAGEDFDPAEYGLAEILQNVGLLKSRDDIRRLYESADIGMCCMFSRHPSYQPLEYMASGMAVVTNANDATSWLFRHESNCLLTEPFPAAFAEAVGRLIDDPNLRTRIVSNGLDEVRALRWEPEFENLWRFITGATVGQT